MSSERMKLFVISILFGSNYADNGICDNNTYACTDILIFLFKTDAYYYQMDGAPCYMLLSITLCKQSYI